MFVAYYCTEPEKRYIKDWQISYAISLLINGVVWGLGLSIAQSLARAMGGDILLASQLDKGQPLVPVVLQTADNRAETKKCALAIGAVKFLAKPYNKQSLLEAIGFAVVTGQKVPAQSNVDDAEELAVLQDELVAAVDSENKQIQQALQQGNLTVAKQHVHNLKGYAGLFWRQQLLQLATALKEVCENPEGIGIALAHVAGINTWLSHRRDWHFLFAARIKEEPIP